MSTYKLVVRGEILAGQDVRLVRARIAKLFKLQDKPGELAVLFSSRPVTVKRGLDIKKARLYYAAIQRAGLRCHVIVECDDLPAPSASVPRNARPMRPAADAAPVRAVATAPRSAASVVPLSSAMAQPSAPVASAPAVDYEQLDTVAPVAESSGAAEPTEAVADAASSSVAPQRSSDTVKTLPDAPKPAVLTEPRKLSAGAGLMWLKEGFDYFMLSPWQWVGAMLATLLIFGVLSQIPVVSLAVNVLIPVFIGGLMWWAYRLHLGHSVTVADVVGGVRAHLPGLLLVGVLWLVGPLAAVLIGLAVMLLTMGGLDGVLALGQVSGGGAALALIAPLLVISALFFVLAMAVWFAPALIVLNDVPPLVAVSMSLKGCRHNLIPFFVYSVVSIVSMIVAAIPFMLGLLVVLPVFVASAFAGYRQIFTEMEHER